MDWSTAEARQHFSQLLQAAHGEPQRIFNREKLAAVIIDADCFEEFRRWQMERQRRSVGDALTELREICAQEDYQLEVPERIDRGNPFA